MAQIMYFASLGESSVAAEQSILAEYLLISLVLPLWIGRFSCE